MRSEQSNDADTNLYFDPEVRNIYDAVDGGYATVDDMKKVAESNKCEAYISDDEKSAVIHLYDTIGKEDNF